jgi:fatty acid desaturase
MRQSTVNLLIPAAVHAPFYLGHRNLRNRRIVVETPAGQPNADQELAAAGTPTTGPMTPRTPDTTEWPTVALGAVVLVGYLLVTWFHRSIPTPLFVFGLAWLTAWWSSFQHELLHGHPFRSAALNDRIGLVSFALWIPFDLYKELHLRHHRNEWLTDPFEDPESYYRSGPEWAAMPAWRQRMWWINRTLLGRLAIGPWLSIGGFLASSARNVVADVSRARRAWIRHVVVLVPVLLWVFGVCGVPVWQYLLGGVWMATSLMKLRSFAEHCWEPGDLSRTAMVHAELPFGMLYLNNNLHHTHHAQPGVAWYRLPALAAELGSDAIAAPGAGVYRGYRDVARRYLVQPLCLPVHPAAPEAAFLVAARSERVASA